MTYPLLACEYLAKQQLNKPEYLIVRKALGLFLGLFGLMVRFDTFGTFWESIVFYASEMMHLPLCVPVLLAAAGDGSAALRAFAALCIVCLGIFSLCSRFVGVRIKCCCE